jgi:hypothetical protein
MARQSTLVADKVPPLAVELTVHYRSRLQSFLERKLNQQP